MYFLRTKLFDFVWRFCRERRGNVAITFALVTIPVIGFVGAAIDYSNANSVKTAMQTALDSTALMLSKDASTLSGDGLQSKAKSYFDALFNRPEANDVTITTSYSTGGGSTLVVNGSTDVPTSFMDIMGFDDIPVTASSTAKWGSTLLRVALVLDNTGSMADNGKMDALKTATKHLLTQLKDAASSNGDVYVSIIPFSKDVNVGSENYNSDWIDWSDWEDENGEWVKTTSCNKGHSRHGRSRCNNSYTWQPDDHSKWNGCVTDRDQDYDQTVTAPDPADANITDSTPSTLFPAEQYSQCPSQMLGLSYDWTAMDDLVDQMSPAGNTNQPIGLVWGWQSLVGGGPLSAPAMDPNDNYQQIIILLSDGLNTENRWSSNQSEIDKRMYDFDTGEGTCSNIKAAGITIYTIQVNTGSKDPTSELLKKCASNTSGSTDHFFLLTKADQLVTTFDTIGTDLTRLRVAK
jgi:Flp pilus assembly protein TadG